MRLSAKEFKAISLVVAGAIFGVYPIIIDNYKEQVEQNILSFDAAIFLASVTMFTFFPFHFMVILFGTGVPQRAIHQRRLKNRWKGKMKIGILNGISWEGNASLFSGTTVKPAQWQIELERISIENNLDTIVEPLSPTVDFSKYVIILNPYGGAYPETNFSNFASLKKIMKFVREGGLFVNVSDIPFYYAYNSNLNRILDTTQSISFGTVLEGTLNITSARPYSLSPFLKELAISIFNADSGIIFNMNELLGKSGMIETAPGQIISRRVAAKESNIESCITPYRAGYNGATEILVTPLFFAKYGNGDFLISLSWMNDKFHDTKNEDAIKSCLCLLAVRWLNSRRHLI